MTHFPTPQERRALGRARRKQLARQEHSQWKPESRRRGPVELLQESMRGRIPQLVTLKYERMLASPFGYFRGAVPVMAADLGTLPSTGIVNRGVTVYGAGSAITSAGAMPRESAIF